MSTLDSLEQYTFSVVIIWMWKPHVIYLADKNM